MPVKRSRSGRSPSCVKAAAPIPAAGSDRPPARSGESDEVKIGGFLEQCHYCRKRIAHDSEVFMYGILMAFCTAECRDYQIALDQSAKKKP